MAHATNNLIRIANGGVSGIGAGSQVSVWLLATADAAATVEAANYLNASAGYLAKGDIILASMARGGTPVIKTYVVTAISAGGAVTIVLQATAAG